MPGGASMMPPLADELGADFRYVALTQYLRLLCVSAVCRCSNVYAASIRRYRCLTPREYAMVGDTFNRRDCSIRRTLGQKLRIPVVSHGTSCVTVLVSFLLPDDVTMQPLEIFRIMAFLSRLGLRRGLSMPTLRHFGRQLPATLVSSHSS